MTGIDFFNLERVQAEIIKNTCEMSSGECLFIDDWLVPFNMKKDFYDDFHNTPEGSKRLGNFICSELKSLIWFFSYKYQIFNLLACSLGSLFL